MPETDTIGLRLLSLDGGGIRGLSTLLILQTIMHRIKTEENLKNMPYPCDYFDLIGGTSTGGIIALMLGRLRMSVEEAIDCYDNLAGKVFSELKRGGDGKYRATLLVEVLKAIVEERTGNSETQLFDDGVLGGICKTFVCAMNAHNMNARIPVLFRTYESPKETSIPCTVWEAARATSAAPTFFKRVFIGPASRPEPFIDGGVGRNNPTSQVLEEAELMFPDRKLACVISIGTGNPGTIEVPSPGFFERNMVPAGVIRAMVAMATDCEEMAQQMEKKFEHWPKMYFRFNVEQGLQKVKLGDWDRMSEVAAHTRNYMSMREVDRRLTSGVKAIREQEGGVKISAISTIPNQHVTIHGPADLDISRSYIPRRPLHFFGRDKEHAEIVQALLSSESVIIPGSGGMGKTTLALAVIHDPRVKDSEHFQSRVYFVDCSTITTLEGLYGQLAVDLHIPKNKRDGHLLETLLGKFQIMAPTLLCFDNFETLWDVFETRSNIQTMLSRFEGIQTLTLFLTMRGIHRPANIQWLKASPHSLNQLSVGALTDIFREESQLSRIDEYATRLINAADGMPLVITLLARLAQIETPKATWARWATNGTSIANEGPGRTMNLDMSIELSLNGPRLRGDVSVVQTLGILAHLPDGLGSPCGISDDLQSGLSNDVNLTNSLHKLLVAGLAYIDTAKCGHYRVLSPISKYAIKHKLMGAGLQSCVIECYIAFILDKSIDFAAQNSVLHATVPQELANIHSILELGLIQHTASKTFDKRHIEALLAHVKWGLFLGFPSPKLLEKAILALPLPLLLQSDCYRALGNVYKYQDRLADAGKSLSQAVELSKQAQDALGKAETCESLGDLYLRQNRLADAERSLRQALQLHKQAQNVLGEANACIGLGELYLQQSRLADAEQSLRQALKLYKQVQNVLGEANAWKSLGYLYLHQDQLGDAEQLLKKAMELYQQAQSVLGEANACKGLGDLYLCQDRHANAEQSLKQALQLYKQVQDVLGEANAWKCLGDLYLHQNQLADAEGSLRKALGLSKQAQDVLCEANTCRSLGDLYLCQGQLANAEKSLRKAVELYKQAQSVRGEANACRTLGNLYLHQNQLAEAEQSLKKAMELSKQAQSVLGEANACDGLGDLYLRQNRLVDAECSLRQAVELHKQAQSVLGEANSCTSLGNLYLHQGQLADAEQSLKKAVGLSKQAQSVLGEANACKSLGDLYLCQDRLADAEQSLRQALKLYKQAQNVLGEANAWKSLGYLYLHQDQLVDAEQSLNKAVELYKQVQSVFGEANAYNSLKKLYLRQGQVADVEQSLTQAKEP